MRKKLITILLPLIVLFACLGFTACDNGGLPEKLATPQNLRRVGNTLVWDAVDYADGYSLLVGGELSERIVTENKCDFFDLNEKKVYLIKLMAYSDRGSANSDEVEFIFAGRSTLPTEGLEFSFNGWGKLGVTKFAVDENGVCVIPAVYRGYKVEYFYTMEPKTSFSDTEKAGSVNPGVSTTQPQVVCSQIKYLYLPYQFASFSAAQFQNFTNLKVIALGDSFGCKEPDRYVVEGNCIIDRKENSVKLGCVGSIIPETVTKIGDQAFAGRNLESFTVPEQITEIGFGAFNNCKKLETLGLPENLQMDKFNLVNGCSSLKQIKIPQGVTNLSEAFVGCTSLTEVTIPDSVTNLDLAFRGCTSLKTCVVPQSVKKLEGTFERCTSLEFVDISGVVELITYSGGFRIIPTFYMCDSLKDVKFGSALFTIGEDSFAFCSSLKEISLPQGLVSVGLGAFSNCTSLEKVTVPDSVTEFGEGEYGIGFVFRNCTALKEVKLPNGIDSIDSMFQNCSSLQTIVIPDSVNTIMGAFKNCTVLESVVLPKQFKLIAADAFENCPLETVFYNGSEAEWESVAANVKGSSELLSATRYYYSETAPALNAEGTAYEGNFWRYENGVPTVWEYQA